MPSENRLTRPCGRCGCPFEDDEIVEMFTKEHSVVRVTPDMSSVTTRRAGDLRLKTVCSPCLRFGDQKLLTEPWSAVTDRDCMPKAGTCRRNHSKTLGIPVPVLRDRHGWETPRMAHDFAHAADNCCPYCEIRFRLMRHGLGEVSLDIINRDLPPDWATNTARACRNCNSAKKCRTQEQWNAYLRGMRRWARWRKGERNMTSLVKLAQYGRRRNPSITDQPAFIFTQIDAIPTSVDPQLSLFP